MFQPDHRNEFNVWILIQELSLVCNMHSLSQAEHNILEIKKMVHTIFFRRSILLYYVYYIESENVNIYKQANFPRLYTVFELLVHSVSAASLMMR